MDRGDYKKIKYEKVSDDAKIILGEIQREMKKKEDKKVQRQEHNLFYSQV